MQVLLQREKIDLPVITIHRILLRRGLVRPQDQHQQAVQRFERGAANQLWQMDFKGPTGWNQTIGPLSVLDDHSRYAITLHSTGSTRAEPVREQLEQAFQRCGVPEEMLMDHGTPWWNMMAATGWTWLTVWLMKQGIRLRFSGYRHPQTQGKVERFHGALAAAMKRRGYPASEQQQRWLDEFRYEYNHVRPHEEHDKIAPRVEEMLELVHMRAFADRLPRQLSGGQQQRIALARCLAIDPKVLLLDEPFGALDKNLRLDMQIEVKRLQRDYGITTVLVTHDQEEALSMADRIAVMNLGRIEQVATPTGIYDHPATLFVNLFVGTTNLIPGRLVGLDAGGCDVQLADGTLRGAPAAALTKGMNVLVSVRPEQWRVQNAAGAGAANGALAGTVKMVMPLGAQVVYDVEIAGGTSVKISRAREADGALLATGSAIHLAPISSAACRVFHAEAN